MFPTSRIAQNPDPHRPLPGFWTCVALVVGNSIGSGVFMLPAAFALAATAFPLWAIAGAGGDALL